MITGCDRDFRRIPSPLNGEKVAKGRMRGGNALHPDSRAGFQSRLLGVIAPHPDPLPVEGRGNFALVCGESQSAVSAPSLGLAISREKRKAWEWLPRLRHSQYDGFLVCLA